MSDEKESEPDSPQPAKKRTQNILSVTSEKLGKDKI